MNRFIKTILLVTLPFSCIDDADISLTYKKNFLIVGYAFNQKQTDIISTEEHDFTYVQILQATSLGDQTWDHFAEAKVILKEQNPGGVQSWKLDFREEEILEGFNGVDYHSGYFAKTPINQRSSYWLEVTIDDVLYKSKVRTIENSATDLDFINGELTLNEEGDIKNSFMIDIAYNKAISALKVLDQYNYRDKRFRDSNLLEVQDLLSNVEYYIIEVPISVDYFFENWLTTQESLNEDFMSQLFSIPPAPLTGEFYHENGALANDFIKGVFFPASGFIIKN